MAGPAGAIGSQAPRQAGRRSATFLAASDLLSIESENVEAFGAESLHARVEELSRELADVRARLAKIEALAGVSGTAAPRAPTPELPQARARAVPVAENIALLGRTLVALGGGYLLRAVTTLGGATSQALLAGATVGLVYGFLWLYWADRAGRSGKLASATFHGFAGVLLTYPALWETTKRFEVLPPAVGGALAVAFLAVGLFVAARRGLPVLAWTATLGSLATIAILFVGTRELLTFLAAGMLAALAVEVLALRDRWPALRWPTALIVDVLLVLTAHYFAVLEGGLPESYPPLAPAGVIGLCLAWPALYLCAVAARCLGRGKPVTVFGVVQTVLSLAIGLSGAVRVIELGGGSPLPVGIASLMLGALCYGAAYVFIERRGGPGRNFFFSTTMGLILILVWSPILLGSTELAIVWSALALLGTWLGGRHDRLMLRYHGAAYLGAAVFGSGLAFAGIDALVAGATSPWRPLSLVAILVAALATCCYGILIAMRSRSRHRSSWDVLPRAMIAAVSVFCVVGLASRWVAGPLAAAPGTAADPAVLASMRTTVLCVTAVVLAWLGRRWSLQTLPWMVYPLMVGGGLRVVLEDLRHGRPLTMFVTLAVYGTSLLLVPRLMKRTD